MIQVKIPSLTPFLRSPTPYRLLRTCTADYAIDDEELSKSGFMLNALFIVESGIQLEKFNYQCMSITMYDVGCGPNKASEKADLHTPNHLRLHGWPTIPAHHLNTLTAF